MKRTKPKSPPPGQRCLSNCATCGYKVPADGRWCYMFRHEPCGVCRQHTGMKVPLVTLA